MALFHLHVTQVKRSAGQSVVTSAAYRAGEKLYSETWNVVQRLQETKRVKERIGGEPNPLTGVLYCADCGQKMYHKRGSTGRPDQPHHEYVCSSYRHYSRSCTCHYIRVSVVESLVLEAIRRVSGYVRENEAEFIERVREKSSLQQEAAVKESRKKLSKAKRRREEISGLIKKLYETYATGKIPENHFSELLSGYDTEQKTLDGEIEKFRCRKRGTGFDNPAPRFRLLHFNGKTVCTTAAATGRFCGGSAPAPPASPKEQDKGKCVTGGRGHLGLRHSPQTRMNTGFLGRSKPRRGAG